MTLRPPPPDLDAILTPEQCAKWLQISVRKLREKANAGQVPFLRLGQKAMRFHPRTVLAKGMK